jgi:hypothetical protein
VTVMVRGRDVISPVHEFVALEKVAVAVDAVTAGPLDPEVVHPLARNETAVDSAAVPLVVSGGENVSVPVMPVHETSPVLTAAVVVVVAAVELGLELGDELQLAARVATSPSAMRGTSLEVRNMDTGRSPPIASTRTLSALARPRRKRSLAGFRRGGVEGRHALTVLLHTVHLEHTGHEGVRHPGVAPRENTSTGTSKPFRTRRPAGRKVKRSPAAEVVAVSTRTSRGMARSASRDARFTTGP